MARRFFTPRETESLLSLPVDQQRRAFFDGWTRKEAYVKAWGGDVAEQLRKIDVSLVPGAPPALLEDRRNPSAPSEWVIESLDLAPDFSAALAVPGPRPSLNYRVW